MSDIIHAFGPNGELSRGAQAALAGFASKDYVDSKVGGTPGSGGTTDHAALTNRDAADQHPIGAITGLQTALNGKSETGHTHAAGAITGLPAAVAEATEGATLAYAFGATDGEPISPWRPGAAIGPNFWQAGNFIIDANYPTPKPVDPFVSHNADGTLTMTATGGNVEVRAQCPLLLFGNTSNKDATYRLEFDIDASGVTAGWWNILATMKDKSGDTTVGVPQRLVTSSSPAASKNRRVIFDFKPTMAGSSFYALELRVKISNNVPAGNVLVVENIILTQTSHLTMPLRIAYNNAASGLHLETVALKNGMERAARGGPFVSTSTILGLAGAVELGRIRAYDTDSPYSVQMPDPMFERATESDISGVGGTGAGWEPLVSELRANNNDQIFQVKSLNGNYEGGDSGLYGNVHGGETEREPIMVRIDYGAGFVPTDATVDGVRDAWRVQVDWKSQLKADSDPAPFVHVDHLMTFFPDGMMRMDRTTTFQRETTVKDVFEWMSSYSTSSPAVGRLGRGLTVLGEVDYFPKVAVPAAPTVTPGTGGSLTAGSKSYRVTALSAHGETTPSPAATATVVADGTATVSWSAVTGATGYRVYGRSAGAEALVATVGPATLTWVDDGTAPATGLPPTKNTTRTTGTPVWDTVEGADATWGVYYRDGWCQGNIYDRDAVLSRPGVEAVRTRLMNAPGSIQKNYANLFYDNGFYELTVPNGTVWSATHWSFVYRPRDPENYHEEIAVRAASLQALKSIYPST